MITQIKNQLRNDLIRSKEEYSQFINSYFRLIGIEHIGIKRLIILLHLYCSYFAYKYLFDVGLISGTLKCIVYEIIFMICVRICTWVIDGFKKS